MRVHCFCVLTRNCDSLSHRHEQCHTALRALHVNYGIKLCRVCVSSQEDPYKTLVSAWHLLEMYRRRKGYTSLSLLDA